MSDQLPSPQPLLPRKWVWHADLQSKTAGRISVLASVETVVATIVYWWIALRFDTHWHLLSSVFIAPLLLLRSPQSIAAGIEWFFRDWFLMTDPKPRQNMKRRSAILIIALVVGLGAHYLTAFSLPAYPKTFSWNLYIVCGLTFFSLASGVAVLIPGALPLSDMFNRRPPFIRWEHNTIKFERILSAGLVACAAFIGGFCAIAIRGAHVTTSFYISFLMFALFALSPRGDPVMIFATALRAIFLRVAATLRFFFVGWLWFPKNWKENNFYIDSFLPAELIPGIRETQMELALDGFLRGLRKDFHVRFLAAPIVGVILFLPAFLYRFNIKATCWFYWPLSYLLKPVPEGDEDSVQRQELCWPLTDLFQRWWIIASVGLTALSLISIEPVAWDLLGDIRPLPLPLKVALALDWQHFAPWHLALGILTLSGTGMLFIASNAKSHADNENWPHFRKKWPLMLRLMTGLRRIRFLAGIALLLMSLGAMLIEWRRPWLEHVVPARWVQAMEHFYRIASK